MKRWNTADMLDTGRKLFAKIYKKKHHANHNHDSRFIAREIDDWNYEELIKWFCDACAELRLRIRKSHSSLAYDLKGVRVAVATLAA
jgi:hypothetical protein